MNKRICIIGSSGHAKEIYWLLQESGLQEEVECFMEPDKYWAEKDVLGIPVKKQSEFDPVLHKVVIGIADPGIRRRVVYEQLSADAEYLSVIHPSCRISQWVDIGRGSIICTNSIVTCDIKIGEFAMVNLNCTVGHDCTIGDFFTGNQSVNISGNCTIGNNVYIGSNAAIKQGLTICDNAVIGMGANVVKNIEQPGTYVGNPAKLLMK